MNANLNANRHTVLSQKTLGFRRVLNTDWPREAYLTAEYRDGRIRRYSVEVICNGIHDSRKEYRRKRDAQAAFDDFGPARD